MSVRPHATTRLPLDGFWWNLIFEFFRKSVDKIQVSLKSDKNNGCFTWRRFHFTTSRWILRMRNVSKEICTENQNSHFILSNFFPENRVVYEIMWKCLVAAERPQTIWRRVACCISKTTRAEAHVLVHATAPKPIPTNMHTHAQHALTHASTHTHRNMQYPLLFHDNYVS